MIQREDGGTVDGPLPPWPPPGLERIQGDLFSVASRGALAGALLVLPLLFVVTRDGGFATLGPLADAWWVTVALATLGLAFALDALAHAGRTLRRAGRALEDGHDLGTVLHVLSDSKRDMGFLLAGGRYFSDLDAAEREAVARIRVFSAILLAVSGLWLPLAFAIGLLFAAQGLLSPLELEFVTIVPGVAGYLFGGVAYLVEERRVRQARKRWYAQAWSDELASTEVARWRQAAAAAGTVGLPDGERGEQKGEGGGKPGEGGAEAGSGGGGVAPAKLLRRASVAMGVAAVLVALPVLTLVPASAVGPVLTTVSAPAFEVYGPRAARAEAFRSYAIGGDPSVTPQEAGRILHALTFVASDEEPGPGERSPEPRVAEPWLPGDGAGNPLGLEPFTWGDSLMGRVSQGLAEEEAAYLADVAQHPMAGHFSRLARATALDAASGRWEAPFPPGLTMATLPVPRFGALRSAAHARIAAAAHAASEGRGDDAAETLSEVIAVGFLLADDGPTLIDNLVGYAIIEAAGSALEDLYRLTGRVGESAQLSRLRQVADRTGAMVGTRLPEGTEAWVRLLPELVLDSTLVRGVRWEYFINLATVAPCLNVNRMVFGTDQAFDAFVDSARVALVRWPSEEPLFELARGGWIGGGDGGSGVMERVLGLYMSTDENSCVRTLRQVQGTGGF